MKISIVTVAYNAAATIEDTIRSVVTQDYDNLEYIIIDGASTDKTLEICRKYEGQISRIISEPDKGIFDAMNKGVAAATGEYVALLNSDDFYAADDIVSTVAAQLERTGVDGLYGDLVMVDPINTEKVARYYRSHKFKLRRFLKGDMPPHPTFFVRRKLYDEYGDFNLKYRIVADFELMMRFLYIKGISTTYLPRTMVRMRTGGNSSGGVGTLRKLNREIHAALKDNGLPASYVSIYSKYFQKALQLVRRERT